MAEVFAAFSEYTDAQDRWQLFHTDEDRAEAHDLAGQHPDKLEELITLWHEEARPRCPGVGGEHAEGSDVQQVRRAG